MLSQWIVIKDMDYKDFVVIGVTILGGLAGGALGPFGIIAGVLVGAGIGATWANYTDRFEYLYLEENEN